MSTNSFLINYCGYPTTPSSFLPDNGLATLASILLEAGHKTTILDYNTIETAERLLPSEYGERLYHLNKEADKNISQIKEIADKIDRIQLNDCRKVADSIVKKIKKERIDWIGFKLWTGRGFANSVKIAEHIKSSIDIPIFAGGPHADYFKEEIYKETNIFDALACGEGEETILGLADYIKNKKKLEEIPNLMFKKGNQIVLNLRKRVEDLNSFPFPVYDSEIYPAMQGDDKIKIIVTELSRGCPNSCYFCGHVNKSGNKWRTKTASRVVDEFEKIIDEWGIKVFRNGDSNTPPHLIKGIAEEILKRKLDIEYSLIGYINYIKKDDLKLLKQSGCFSIIFGIESGNQYILDTSIGKKVKVEKAAEMIKSVKDAGIFTITSFIIPAPFETEQTKKDTLEFILKTKPDATNFCVPTITPYSEWGDNPKKFGIELSENYFKELMYFTPTLFYPPSMWQRLNYKIAGKDFKDLARESSELLERIDQTGLLTQVIDDIALMAKYSNTDIRDFRDNTRKYLLTGNYDEIKKLVKKINKGIKHEL